MKEGLRKVLFNQNDQDFTYGDLGLDDTKEFKDERQGYFHCWGNVAFYDSEEAKFKLRKVAIVEECKTGRVFEVAPSCLRFEEPFV